MQLEPTHRLAPCILILSSRAVNIILLDPPIRVRRPWTPVGCLVFGSALGQYKAKSALVCLASSRITSTPTWTPRGIKTSSITQLLRSPPALMDMSDIHTGPARCTGQTFPVCCASHTLFLLWDRGWVEFQSFLSTRQDPSPVGPTWGYVKLLVVSPWAQQDQRLV